MKLKKNQYWLLNTPNDNFEFEQKSNFFLKGDFEYSWQAVDFIPFLFLNILHTFFYNRIPSYLWNWQTRIIIINSLLRNPRTIASIRLGLKRQTLNRINAELHCKIPYVMTIDCIIFYTPYYQFFYIWFL
jgi:hypothetical protein